MSYLSRMTAARAQEAYRKAPLPPRSPPSHVPVDEHVMPFWWSIVQDRAADEWADVELFLVAQLAWTAAEIEREGRLLAAEGMVVPHPTTGRPARNPRVKTLARFIQWELALRRSLRLGGVVRRRADRLHGNMHK